MPGHAFLGRKAVGLRPSWTWFGIPVSIVPADRRLPCGEPSPKPPITQRTVTLSGGGSLHRARARGALLFYSNLMSAERVVLSSQVRRLASLLAEARFKSGKLNHRVAVGFSGNTSRYRHWHGH